MAKPCPETPSPLVNTADPRQDVQRERTLGPDQHRYRVAESLLPAECEGLSVLELGGGTAEMSRRMVERELRVTFVDLNEHNIRKAQALGIESLQLDLNRGLSRFRNEQFDGVLMLEIIEHVVAAENLLSEVSRVLKRSGFLILSTPNFAFFLNRLRILRGQLSADEGYHYRFFTVETLVQRLRHVGFEVEQQAHTAPAFGANFVWSRLMGRPRLHVHVPAAAAPLFAQTLIVRARKTGPGSQRGEV
jgi:2-polyprenyl-3-methyl-5-hydroxy-6-metoxy-1,4-benzoquinol methylase